MLRSILIIFVLPAFSLKANTSQYFFYNPDGLGAHAFYDPVSFTLESSFEAAYNNRIDKINYKNGIKNVLKSIANPLATIEQNTSYRNFITREVFPLSLNGAWVPNYTWHLWGGGFRTRLLTEYFQDKGASYPRTYAWVFMYLGHFMNEVQQASDLSNGSVDAIADLLIFDWIGKLLFMNDGISHFAAKTLHLKEWTYRMSFDFFNKRLINNGQQYWMRYQILDWFSLSMLQGNMHNSLCLTFHNSQEQQISLGFGFKFEDFMTKQGSPYPVSSNWGMFLAYSLADNPYVTLVYRTKKKYYNEHVKHESTDRDLLINVYPSDFLSIKGIKLGFLLGSHNSIPFFGVTTGSIPVGFHVASKDPYKN